MLPLLARELQQEQTFVISSRSLLTNCRVCVRVYFFPSFQSTNEHVNIRKYKYFFPNVNGRRAYKNPWFKGWLGNMMDRFNPSEKVYTIPEDFQSLLQSNGENNV